MGMVTGPFFISDRDKVHHSEGRQHVNSYMMISAIIITIMNVGVLLLFEERPKIYPSKAAQISTKVQFDMKKDLKLILHNKNYIFLTITYAMLYGVYTCLGAIINNLVSAYGFGSVDASIFGAVFIVSGLVGSFVISGFLDKYNAYIKTLRLVCFSSLFWGSCLRFTLPLGPEYMLYAAINIGIAGFSIIPIIPVAYSFSVELTYPVSEAMSNGSLMLASQLLGVAATIVSTKLADANPNMCIYMFLAMITLGCFSTFFIEEDLRRVNLGKREQEAKEKARESQSVCIPSNPPSMIMDIKVENVDSD